MLERLSRAWARREASLPVIGRARIRRPRPLTPLSRYYGFDRGTPIDRFWIERFLERHGAQDEYALGDIRGAVLEIGGSEYVGRFGRPGSGPGMVNSIDVLHVDRSNPEATVVGDLGTGEGVPEAAYDCIICTQTLHVIYGVHEAISTLHRALRPGGVLLATLPGISSRSKPDADRWGDYWRFTSLSTRRLFEEAFPAELVRVEAFGNMRAAIGLLQGLSAQELSPAELDMRDPDYEVLLAVRAQKPD
jgi:SAM-dependent methyltransferase